MATAPVLCSCGILAVRRCDDCRTALCESCAYVWRWGRNARLCENCMPGCTMCGKPAAHPCSICQALICAVHTVELPNPDPFRWTGRRYDGVDSFVGAGGHTLQYCISCHAKREEHERARTSGIDDPEVFGMQKEINEEKTRRTPAPRDAKKRSDVLARKRIFENFQGPNGIPLMDAWFLPDAARYRIAGMVASLLAAGIEPVRSYRSYSVGRFTQRFTHGDFVTGWLVRFPKTENEYRGMSGLQEVDYSESLIVNDSYHVYSGLTLEMRKRSGQDRLWAEAYEVVDDVVARMASLSIDWIEPGRSTYEQSQ
jgi:hypothetical protein